MLFVAILPVPKRLTWLQGHIYSELLCWLSFKDSNVCCISCINLVNIWFNKLLGNLDKASKSNLHLHLGHRGWREMETLLPNKFQQQGNIQLGRNGEHRLGNFILLLPPSNRRSRSRRQNYRAETRTQDNFSINLNPVGSYEGGVQQNTTWKTRI